MTDLWVKYRIQPDHANRGQTEALRPPSSFEILQAALDLDGVETVDWCETHFESAWSLDECWKQVYGEDHHYVPHDSPCSVVPRAIIPLPEDPS